MKINNIITAFVCCMIFAGCKKDDTLILKDLPKEVTTTVSFSKDLAKLFVANCGTSGCHDKRAPVLLEDQAYNSLTKGNFIDTKSPENSIIYKRLTGKLSPAMPLGKATNPSNINSLVLAWIKQGAKKN